MTFDGYKKLILHCGPHKTGTSAIQNTMRLNTEQLRTESIHYPDYKGANIAERLNGNHSLVAQYLDRSNTSFFECADYLLDLESNCDTLLLSAERFAQRNIMTEILKDLQNFKGEVLFVYYLRRYDHYCESAYAESVKRHRTGPIDISLWKTSFKSMLEPVVAQYGTKNIALRPYVPDQWPNRSLLHDFLKAISHDTLINTISPPEKRNIRYPRQATFLLSRIENINDKKNIDDFFMASPECLPAEKSSFFLPPQKRMELNAERLVIDQPFFEENGLGQLNSFLGIETSIDEPEWIEFTPDWEWHSNILTHSVNQFSLIIPRTRPKQLILPELPSHKPVEPVVPEQVPSTPEQQASRYTPKRVAKGILRRVRALVS